MEILQKIEGIRQKMIPYRERGLRIYSTEPHPIAMAAILKFLKLNRNNIGTHTRASNNEVWGLGNLEKEAIFMIGDLMGSNKIDGYITQKRSSH